MKFPRALGTSQNRRRIIATAAGIAAAALVLSGCAGSSAPSGDGGSATKGTVNWWSWTPDNDLAAREIAAFNKEYPDIKVVYKKVPNTSYTAALRPALASDVGPDVFTVAASGSTAAVKTFAPYAIDLAPAAKKLLGDDWKSKLYGPGVDAFTVNGKFVGMQFGRVAAGFLWINKDLFDKYDLKPPTTLDEWKSVCATFRSKGLGCFKEGAGGTAGFDVDTLHTIANSIQPGYWTDVTTGKAKWTDDTMVQSLATFTQLSKDGILDDGAVGIQQYPDVNNAFLSGKVPMVQMGSWYEQYTTENSLTAALAGAGVSKDTKHVTIIPVPFPDVAGKGNVGALFSDPDAAQAVNAKSKVRNAATTFALWLGASKNGQQVVADNIDEYPTLTGVEPDFDSIKLVNPSVQKPALLDLTKKVADATEPRNANIPAVISQAIIDANQSVLTGSKSPKDAAAAIQQVQDANPSSN